MSAAAALLGGWLLDRAVGDPARHHPVAWFGRVAVACERRWHRDSRTAGVGYALVLVAVPALVGRDPARLDDAGLCRAAVESVAENTADAVVGPLLYGAVLGPAGVVAHRCANTLDALVGHRTRRHRRFGWAAARLDDVLNWLPARVCAALAAAAAPVVGGSPAAALAVWRRDGARHPSPNAGRCEAAFAGALGVRLGGVNDYGAAGVELRGPIPRGGDVSGALLIAAVRGGPTTTRRRA